MTVTMDFPPEVVASLEAEAAAAGLSINRYLERVVELRRATQGTATAVEPSAEEWVRQFRAWIHSHHGLPVLSEEAISREAIYSESGES